MHPEGGDQRIESGTAINTGGSDVGARLGFNARRCREVMEDEC